MSSKDNDESKTPLDERVDCLTNEDCSSNRTEIKYESKMTIEDCIKARDYRKLCNKVAIKVGFNPLSKGTEYLINSIVFLFENGLDVKQYKVAFEEVAEMKYTSPVRVRANITNAIDTMARRMNEKKFSELFPEYDGRKPSLVYTLALALERLDSIFK